MQELGYVLRELSYSMKQDLERVRKHRTQWRESTMLQAQTSSQFEDFSGMETGDICTGLGMHFDAMVTKFVPRSR